MHTNLLLGSKQNKKVCTYHNILCLGFSQFDIIHIFINVEKNAKTFH